MTQSPQSRRQFLRFAGASGLVLAAAPSLLAACGGSTSTGVESSIAGAQDLGNLKVGYLPITDASPLVVAHANGLFDSAGFTAQDPTLFRSWPDLVEAFQAGSVDVVHMLMPLAVQLRFGAKLPLKVVAWNHTNGSALTVADRIQTVDDLAGETIAVPFWWSIHNVIVQKILRANGIEPILDGKPSKANKTTKLVVLPPADMVPALASGSVAGFIVADPFNALAETTKSGKILRFTGDVWRDHACCVTVVSEAFVTDKPEAAQGLVNSLATAQLAINSDRAGIAKVLSEKKYLPQPLPAIERALTHYVTDEYAPNGAITHPEWESDRIGFQPYAFPSYTAELIGALRETRIAGDSAFLADIDDAKAHAELVAEGLAKSAIESNGGLSKFGLASFERLETIAP